MEILIDEADDAWLMIDASHCKVHLHAAGAKGSNQDMSRTKGSLTQNCTTYIAPKDPDAGGTWIATNKYGFSICILNKGLRKLRR